MEIFNEIFQARKLGLLYYLLAFPFCFYGTTTTLSYTSSSLSLVLFTLFFINCINRLRKTKLQLSRRWI